MVDTKLADVQNQVQEEWAPIFFDEFVEYSRLARIVMRQPTNAEGAPIEIPQGGDTVYVSQIDEASGETLTIGVNAQKFNPTKLSTTRVQIQANKRFVASYEFNDVVEIQSQLGQADSAIRMSLMQAFEKQVNQYLFDLVDVSTSSPDHLLNGVSDFNAAQLSAVRTLAAKAQWPGSGRDWFLLADPQYHGDMLDDTTLSSADYGGDDFPVINGEIMKPRMGFRIVEDSTDGLLSLLTSNSNLSLGSAGTADIALALHRYFMHFVMQTQPTFEISRLHSNREFGYVISVDAIGGGTLAPNGTSKGIVVYNS